MYYKKLLSLALVLFTFNAQASENESCVQLYQQKIQKIERTIIPSRGALINTSTGGVVSQLTLISLGMFNPASAIASAGVIVGVGTYFGIQKARMRPLEQAVDLYNAVKKKRGKIIKKTKRILKRKGAEYDDAFTDFVVRGMDLGAFCEYDNKKEKYILLKYKNIINLYINRFM